MVFAFILKQNHASPLKKQVRCISPHQAYFKLTLRRPIVGSKRPPLLKIDVKLPPLATKQNSYIFSLQLPRAPMSIFLPQTFCRQCGKHATCQRH